MESAKIRIKVGAVEVEYEGSEAFLRGDLADLITSLVELSSSVLPAEAPIEDGADQGPIATGDDFNASTNTIAAHTSARTAPELSMCALAHLELVQGQSKTTRDQIIAEMKSATSFFATNMTRNIKRELGILVKLKKINQVAVDTYALSAAKRSAFSGKIAAIA